MQSSNISSFSCARRTDHVDSLPPRHEIYPASPSRALFKVPTAEKLAEKIVDNELAKKNTYEILAIVSEGGLVWRYFVKSRAGSRDAVVNKSFSGEIFPNNEIDVWGEKPYGKRMGLVHVTGR